MPRDARAGASPVRLLALVALLNAIVLVLTARQQNYDSNFLFVWEATALLAGDSPYRDFFEWGAPLAAYLSAAAQLLTGNRLIGEFALQWLGIIAGAVISFHLGLRLSRSVMASLVMFVFAVAMLAMTAPYHYPKLLWYPLAIWLIWSYMERPTVRRAAILGIATAAAFLFRPDHGIYIAGAAVLAFGLTRLVMPASRSLQSACVESGMSGAAALLVLAPWLILVQTHEGLREYVESRSSLWAAGLPYSNPYASLLRLHVSLEWTLPARPEALMWLQQIALLVPVLLLIGAGLDALRRRRPDERVPLDTYVIVVAAALLAVVDWRLFREPGYVVAVAPITAALGARLLVGSSRRSRAAADGAVTWMQRVRATIRLAVAVAMLSVTAVASFVCARDSGILAPWRLATEVPDAFTELLASPPIDGFAPLDDIARLDRSTWNDQQVHAVRVMMRYLHACTAPGDRVLVTGQTPFAVPYYVERSIAGGHLYWHTRWRDDPVHEQQSLAMLQRQSVPFAYSTHDPVLNDLRQYPRIHEYLLTHYEALEGSDGLLLVDKRRQPTGTFWDLGFPCFR